MIIKFLLFALAFGLFSNSYAQEVDTLDIENHPQDSFPKISLTIKDHSFTYYGSISSEDRPLAFVDSKQKIQGEIPLSGYIFSKEFVESFRIPNTISGKTKNEFMKFFSEKDTGKIVDFILSVNDKKRTAQSDKEVELIKKLISTKKTDDDPALTPYFSTGYIEIKSPKQNNERYFIKLSDIHKASIQLNNDKTKITILKAISVYSFQNVLSSLNFGDIENGSREDLLYRKMENINLSLCTRNCQTNPGTDLTSFALNIGKIVSFEVVGNSKIADMDDFNNYVLAQQFCLLRNFSNACRENELENEIQSLSTNEIIKRLIDKHKSAEKLCLFLQK